MTWVGKSALRKEGEKKLKGEAKYIDDIHFPNMIYGITLRSPMARGILKRIEFLPGVNWESIITVTAKDIQRVAKQYLNADNRTVGILIPQPPKAAEPQPTAAHAGKS